MNRATAQVKELHKAFDLLIQMTPHLPPEDCRKRRKLILEKEYRAYKRAEQKSDIVRISNGLAEIIYCCVGAALEYGIPINRVFSEVHRAKICEEHPKIAEILTEEMYGEIEERNHMLMTK